MTGSRIDQIAGASPGRAALISLTSYPSCHEGSGVGRAARPRSVGLGRDRRPTIRSVRSTHRTRAPRSILDQAVIASSAIEDILPRPARQDVVAVAAEEHIVAVA